MKPSQTEITKVEMYWSLLKAAAIVVITVLTPVLLMLLAAILSRG